MKLAIFDLDETLTRTGAADGTFFGQALADTFGLMLDEGAWRDCPDVSDPGIVEHLFTHRLGRPVTTPDVERILCRLLELFESHRNHAPSAFAAAPGAVAMLSALERDGWRWAIATGCWRASAEFKLQAACIPYVDVPRAHGEDGPAREAIVHQAIARAQASFGDATRVVSIGDGIWDVAAAQALRLPFVGVGNADRAEALRAAGARVVVPDFADVDAFLCALALAAIPREVA